MIPLLARAGAWLFKNPIMIAVVILSISTVFFWVQTKYHKNQAEKAITRALGAEEALSRAKARDDALKALETKHREDDESIDNLIDSRNYFDTVGSM